MKNIKYIFSLLIVLAFFSACTDDDKVTPLFSELPNGAYLTTTIVSGTINFNDLASSKFEANLVPTYNADKASISSVDVFVGFKDNTTGNGTTVVAEKLLKTIAGTQFSLGQPTKLIVTATEAMASLAITPAQMDGSDAILVRLLLKMSDGQLFTASNTSANVKSGVYNSPFSWTVSLVCPSDLIAKFDIMQTNFKFRGAPEPGTLNLTGGEFKRVDGVTYSILPGADFGWWNFLYGAGSGYATGITLKEACGKLTLSGSDQFGDTYKILPGTVIVAGNKLTYQWDNTWGEEGTVTLTRTDGKLWPTNLK
ncbi:hypothetical protein [Lutibacter sp.]|uniref:hypothetical protein n=1 Tax=Lutibacter sp. TaxID=1925666 RepID=UPI002734137B|nr:hypothetical protein [Lutibacter sp.]MDP3311838.1 hypothetical protein [Lutibacter sp.]